jgi:hypothetical protein
MHLRSMAIRRVAKCAAGRDSVRGPVANQGPQGTAAVKIWIAFGAEYWYDFRVDCPSKEADYNEDSQAVGFR